MRGLTTPLPPSFISLMFFILPSTSSIIFSAFPCVAYEQEPGVMVSYQQVDLSITCSSNGETMTRPRRFLVFYSSLMIVVFPLGMPVLLFLMLWLKRRAIEGRESRRGDEQLANLAFLFRVYGRDHWAFAPLDLVRRLLLSSVLMALPSISTLFIEAFCVSIFAVIAWREVGPFW